MTEEDLKSFWQNMKPKHIITYLLVVGAVVMACLGVHGWGWLLFVAFLLS